MGWVRESRGLGADELVVRDLEAGADVIRLTVDDLATRRFDELALQDDGTVAFVYSNRNFSRIAWATPGTPGARVVDRGRFEDLALARRAGCCTSAPSRSGGSWAS